MRYCPTKEDCKNNWRGWTAVEMVDVLKGIRNTFPEALVDIFYQAHIYFFSRFRLDYDNF